MYFPNSAMLTWSYRVAQLAWEAEPVVAAAQVLLEAVDVEAGGTAAKRTNALLAVLDAAAVVANIGVRDATSVSEEVDLEANNAGLDSVAAHASAKLDAGGDAEACAKVLSFDSLGFAPALPVLASSLPAPGATALDADSAIGRAEHIDNEAVAARGRWVLKGYKTLFAHIFYFDPPRQALADAPYEQREFDDFARAQTRKPSEALLDSHERNSHRVG